MGGGFGGGKSNSKLMNMITPEQRELLSGVIGQIMPQLGQGVETYGGQITPGTSPLMQQGFNALSGAFGGESGGALSQMLSGQSSYEVDPAARQQVYDAEKAAAMNTFRKDVMPTINEAYQGAGRSGGLESALAGAGGEVELLVIARFLDVGFELRDRQHVIDDAGQAMAMFSHDR